MGRARVPGLRPVVVLAVVGGLVLLSLVPTGAYPTSHGAAPTASPLAAAPSHPGFGASQAFPSQGPLPASNGARASASPAGGSVGTTLSLNLLNGSTHLTFPLESQIGWAQSIATSPTGSAVFAAGRCSQNASETCVEQIENSTGAVANAFIAPNCTGVGGLPVEGLAVSPSGGILYLACASGNLVAVNATTGSLLGTVPPPVATGGGACGPGEASVGTALDAQDGLLFLLDASTCIGSAGVSGFHITLDAISTATLAVEWNLTYVSYFGSSYLAETEPLAFDPALGQLYVDMPATNASSSQPLLDQVGIVSPQTGSLAERVTTPNPWVAASWLTYVPARSSVYTIGVAPATSTVTESIERIDPVLDKETPVMNVTGSPGHTPFDRYFGLVASAGATGELTVLGQWVNSPSGGGGPTELEPYNALSLLLPSRAILADVRVPGVLYGGAAIGQGSSLALLDGADDSVILTSGNPPTAERTALLGSAFQEEAVDPTNGTLWVVLDSACAIDYGGPCANATLEVFPSDATRPSETAQLPEGTPSGITYDPLDHEFFIFSSCRPGTNPYCVGNDTLTAYDSSGKWLSTTVLPSAYFSPPGSSLVVDGATGDLVAQLLSVRGSGLLFIPPTDAAASTERFLLGPPGAPVCDSRLWLAYDSVDSLLLIRSQCLLASLHGTVPVQWGLNASTLNPSYVANATNGSGPLSFDPASDMLYMANGSALVRISPLTGVSLGTFTPTGGVTDVVYDPGGNALYLMGTNLTVVNASSLILLETAPFAGLPPAVLVVNVAVDPRTGTAFLATDALAMVVEVPGPGRAVFAVTFSESGLPTFSPWRVNVSAPGANVSGAGPLTELLPNGSYSYSVSGPPGYVPVAGSPYLPGGHGTVVVNGTVVEITATFSPALFRVVFHASVSGGGWSAYLLPTAGSSANASCDCTASGSVVTFLRPDGTYDYLLEGNASKAAVTGLPASGQVTVSGANVWLNFSINVSPSPSLTFQSVGIPTGASWCVKLAGARQECTTMGRLAFGGLVPGNYSYTVRSPAGFLPKHPTGHVRLGRTGASVGVPFRTAAYLVAFAESGLATGHAWSVTIDGRRLSGRHAQLSLMLSNGSYVFSTESLPGYTGGQSGVVTIDGRPSLVAAPYVRVVYAVTISEVGLPLFTAWSIRVGSNDFTVKSGTLVIHEPNGSYGLHVGLVVGYGHSIVPATLHVLAGPASVTVTFHLLHGASPTTHLSPANQPPEGMRDAPDAAARPP